MNKFFFTLLAGFFLIVPSVHAQANLPLLNPDFSIVPAQCTSCPCGFAGTMQLAQNLMNVGIALGILIMLFVIIYAGVLFLMSPTAPENREKGKSMFTNAIIGFLIIISAWLLIDTVMKTLYNPNATVGGSAKFGPWNTIIGETGEWCIQARETKPLFEGGDVGNVDDVINGGTGGTGGVTGAAGCPTCVSLSEKGISCKNERSCTLDPAVADRIKRLWDNYSGTWTVTEAFPPTYNHSNQCHKNGTCIDAGFRGNTTYTAANISAFASAAQNAGLRPVFETSSCSLRDEARKAGVRAYCSSDSGYGHITGNHFSVYGN